LASSGKKVVQTELDSKEYEILSSFAKQQGLTIKEAARKAILEISISGIDLKNDPFFKLKPVPFKTRIKNSEIDRVLYSGKH
jgi:hypothetical protein